MKLLSIVGARPQFIKLKPFSNELQKYKHNHVIVHTGQHYDINMSEIFFNGLGIPHPNVNLNVGSGSHANQTAEILIRVEKEIYESRPDCVLVYGDTNSTLAGALAAAKLSIPVAHIESGLRSFNRAMPEEINRIMTDHISNFLFAPTKISLKNLEREGLGQNSYLVGDLMADLLIELLPKLNELPELNMSLTKQSYVVATIHRASNTDDPVQLNRIITSLSELDYQVMLPAHPRLKFAMENFEIKVDESQIKLLDPLGYLEMLKLVRHSKAAITDSGGLQKEAYLLGIPCITIRTETEWMETLIGNMNVLAPLAENLNELCNREVDSVIKPPFELGNTAHRIIEILEKKFG
jgi:UDP-N-acetylglucosamine 2-epimerase